MQLSAALGWVRRQLTLTTLLSAVFVGYFGNSMLVMYRVAVPAVPSIYREDGSKKPVIESLWNDAPGLDAELWLSTDQTFVPAESVRLYQGHELPFTWDLNVELDLLLEFSAKRGRPLQLRARCDDMALPISEHCRAAAAVWTASSPDVNVSTSGSGATSSLVIGAWEGAVARALREALRQGRPVFAHVFVAWAGKPLMPGAPTYSAFHATNARTAIVQSVAYVPPKLTRNLWVELVSVIADWIGVESPYAPVVPHARISATGGNASGLLQTAASRDRGDAQAVPITGDMWPHWAGQLDVRLIMDTIPYPSGEVPPALAPYLHTVTSGGRRVYIPRLAANPVRPTRERFHALNQSLSAIPLRVTLQPTSIGKWQLLQLLDRSLNTQKEFGATDKDTDDVIRLMAETPLWLLGVTFFVSIVHMLFDILAFKSDISFWSGTKSLRGISVMSLGTSLISNIIITAYLQFEGSSLLLLIPQAANTLLFVWKLAISSGIVWERRFFIIPVPRYDAQLHSTATEGRTQDLDKVAMRYMFMLLTPVLIGFAFYNLAFQEFSSWYEYGLTTAVSAVYTFGFVLMTPQLFINWKLRSVAHMPWSVLFYRFFNTVIDDLFAGIIKMPMMHRVSVFRDDVIFVIYMFQRWNYPVDKSRPAEGFEDAADGAPASEPLADSAATDLSEKDE